MAQHSLSALKSQYQVLIIGAGINGCGLFRDLCLQGVDCLLIDRGDVCEGASAASSRLIHGGIKYLETGEFRLVRESAMERNRLLRNAPHVVKPLEVVLPVQSWFGGVLSSAFRFLGFKTKLNDRGALITKLGLRLYDSYSRRIQALPNHRFWGRRQLRSAYPGFAKNFKAAGLYHEGHISHAERLGLELVLDGFAANPNSRLQTYATVVRDGSTKGLMLEDSLTAERKHIACDVVVNASGAWIDEVNASLGISAQRMGGTKGSHLLVDNPELHDALDGRMIYFGTPDGRINLAYPYFGRVLVGATDVPIADPDAAVCTDEEKAYLLASLREIFPDIAINEEHVLLTYCGVRPLPRTDQTEAGLITRDHSIARDMLPGSSIPVFSLIGGKWTTFRAFAEQAADQVLHHLGRQRLVSTEDVAIGGGKDFPKPNEVEHYLQALSNRFGLDMDRAQLLFKRYGTRTSSVAKSCVDEGSSPLRTLPMLLIGEITHICRHEMVRCLTDILLRRTTFTMEGRLNARVAEEVATIAAKELGWSASRLALELQNTHNELKRHSVDLGLAKSVAA